ncbi:DMT family transporter [Ancylomarina sp. 16SWW S1-10-2]|uniref:DMT family transporter n=1 Tax=Ancylomarina sp. 16SWW S1-10-2 TaxID=2499681 RepID=UPI0012AE7050|nr:DMT family transporter [Ancylomarina sp. 16SWW S1-10-2]MRT94352.1 DMT family transporter [Ancylomarina sp. 16SWW S1-10-2]
MKNNKFLIGMGFALLATAFWSGNFVVSRGLSESIHPFSLAFYRWFMASLIFTPFAIKSVKKEWSIIKKRFPYLFITALLGVSIFNTLIYFAGRSTTAVNMSLIMLTFPIFILLISILFFKERLGLKKILGILVVLSGVISIASQGHPSNLLDLTLNEGDPLMLLAAFMFAVHSHLIKNKDKQMSIITLQYSTFAIGAILLLPFHLWVSNTSQEVVFTLPIIGSILYIAVCASLVSFLSWNKAIEKIGAVSAGMIYYLLPLFSGLVAFILLGEKLHFYHLISGLLIVSGILIINRKSKKQVISQKL